MDRSPSRARKTRSRLSPPGSGRNILPVGKLPAVLLRSLLARFPGHRDSRVAVGPGIGLDAAAIDINRHYLIAKTDPITFVTEEIGTYALTINANDLATMGATPRWFLTTLLLPPQTARRHVFRIVDQLQADCRRLKVSLCGGHTEVTPAVTRPVVVGCLLGECRKDRLITTAGAQVDDAILLTKGIPIEAVAIFARERKDDLRRRYAPPFVARCRRYLVNPGLSIVDDAALALEAGGVHAMHDPTEGGLSAALYEVAEAAGVGIQVEEASILVLPEGKRLCLDFRMNPMGAIASGALIICADSRRERAIVSRLAGAGIAAARIGTVVPEREGVRMIRDKGRSRPVPKFCVDEIARVLR
jgi:hydrogenase expression/formation protein HypE